MKKETQIVEEEIIDIIVDAFKDPIDGKSTDSDEYYIRERSKKILKALIEEDVISKVEIRNQQALNEELLWSAKQGRLDDVRLLIEHGADVGAHNNYSIRLASKKGHLKVVKFLIDNGADVTALGDVAIKDAISRGHLEVVKLLKKHGAKL